MAVLACGNCGGALEVNEGDKICVCRYCGFSNEVVTMEQDLERFKQEMVSWVSGLGTAGGSNVDAGMRRVYFQDSIYPSVLTEFSNLVGETQDVLDFPLVYLRIFNRVPGLEIQSSWNPQHGKPLKELARKLASPEFGGFVSGAEGRWQVSELRFRSICIPMLMDVITLANTPSEKSFKQSSNILSQLASESDKLARGAEESDAECANYYDLLSKRFKIASDSFTTFSETINSGKRIPQEWLDGELSQLKELQAQLSELQKLSVTDRVYLQTGLENDASATSAAFSISNLYPSITQVPFENYMQAVESLAERTLFRAPPDNMEHLSWFGFGLDSTKLSWFLTALETTITRDSYPIMAEPEAIGAWLRKKRNVKGIFLYPFYLARITTVLKSGFLLWKKGEEEAFLSLCDAAYNLAPNFCNNDFPSLMTPGFKKMVGSKREQVLIELAKQNARPKPEHWVALPPTVTPQDIQLLYRTAHNYLEETQLSATQGKVASIPSSYKKMGFDPGKVKALSVEVSQLVFLPLAVTSDGVDLLGQHLDLECGLAHRYDLCKEYMDFTKSINATSSA